MTTHTWSGWYPVPTLHYGDALRAAKLAAAIDHPDTPIDNMMTPHIRLTPYAVRVLVIGKPTAGAAR